MSTRAVTDVEAPRVVERLREVVAREGNQSKAARKLGVSQQTVSKTLAGDPVGMLLARKVADYFSLSFDELIGRVAPTASDSDPQAQVRSTPLYRNASPAVRRRFDELAPYTRTPDGAAPRDVLWFTRRLVGLLDDEREGLLEAGPPGAEPEPMPASRPTPPRKAKPRRA